MKLNKKQIKELIASGCEYDEAVRLVQNGIRIKRVEGKRGKRDKGTYHRPRVEE